MLNCRVPVIFGSNADCLHGGLLCFHAGCPGNELAVGGLCLAFDITGRQVAPSRGAQSLPLLSDVRVSHAVEQEYEQAL